MGRAGRPLPPELQELREEGLPDSWERYWHGERQVMSLEGEGCTLRSPLFPGSVHLPQMLGRLPMSSEQRLQFLSTLRISKDASLSLEDPILRAILESEWQRVKGEPWALAYQDKDERERLFRLWEEKVLGPLQKESWSRDEEGLGVLRKKITSLLAVACLDTEGPFSKRNESPLDILDRDYISADRSSDEEWFRENIVPEMHFLFCTPSGDRSEELLSSVWQKAVQAIPLDKSCDVAKHSHMLASLVEKGAGLQAAKDFINYPMASWKGVHQELFRRINWNEEISSGSIQRAAEEVCIEQLIRIYYGFSQGNPVLLAEAQADKARAWALYQDRVLQGENPPSPLEGIRALFRAEGKEDLYGRLVDAARDQRGRLRGGIDVEKALRNHWSLEEAMQGSFSQSIVKAIKQEYGLPIII